MQVAPDASYGTPPLCVRAAAFHDTLSSLGYIGTYVGMSMYILCIKYAMLLICCALSELECKYYLIKWDTEEEEQ